MSTKKPAISADIEAEYDKWIDFISDYEYRIKPKAKKTVVFRNWIASDGSIHVAINNHQISRKYKWLGDWQEVEIEEND